MFTYPSCAGYRPVAVIEVPMLAAGPGPVP